MELALGVRISTKKPEKIRKIEVLGHFGVKFLVKIVKIPLKMDFTFFAKSYIIGAVNKLSHSNKTRRNKNESEECKKGR